MNKIRAKTVQVFSLWVILGFVSVFSMSLDKINRGTCLIENGKPTAVLKAFLDQEYVKSDSLDDIVKETQQSWLRGKRQELWELTPCVNSDLSKQFTKLGLVEAVSPTKKHYQYALLLGATVPMMQQRLTYLKMLHDKGIQFDNLVVMAGQRPLAVDGDKITEYKLASTIKTEVDAARALIARESWLSASNNMQVTIVDSPLIMEDGYLRRPITEDTVKTWLESNPTPGSVLGISNQPFVGKQAQVLINILPKGFTIEAVGQKAQSSTPTAVYLDALARWIYLIDKHIKTQVA